MGIVEMPQSTIDLIFQSNGLIGSHAGSDIGKIRSETQRSQENGTIVKVILGNRASSSPSAGLIGTNTTRPHLLCVTLDATQ